MDQLGIEYETTEFASRQIEHSLQTTYTDQVLQDGDLYDFVVFGPSELATQADNIDRLVKSDDFTTFVWSFFTPLKQFDEAARGLLRLLVHARCAQHLRLHGRAPRRRRRLRDEPRHPGHHRRPALRRTSRTASTEKGNWELAYEHYGDYTREGGFDGTQLILQAYPEVTTDPQRQHRDVDGLGRGADRRRPREGHLRDGLGRHRAGARRDPPRRARRDADAHG